MCASSQAQYGAALAADAAAVGKSEVEFLVTGVAPRPAGAALVDDWNCLRVRGCVQHLWLGTSLACHRCCLFPGPRCSLPRMLAEEARSTPCLRGLGTDATPC
jgi:hypothetical protein